MGSTTGVQPPAAAQPRQREISPSELAMRIGVVAAETAFASFARSIDLQEAADGGWDFEGCIGPAEWPVFSLVLDTLAAAGPDDPRSLEERRADAVQDLARICLAVKDAHSR